MDKRQETFWTVVVTWLLLILLLSLMFSCTTTKYVEVPVVKTDTVYQSKVVNDSVYIHDSTFVKVAGDTVYMERWHTRWRERVVTDTIYESRRDTVTLAYPVEVVKEVEKELSGWQQFRLWFANIMLAVVALAIGLWVWKKT